MTQIDPDDEVRVHYQLIQHGIVVAEVEGPLNEARREIWHYSAMYCQDGEPVTIRCCGDTELSSLANPDEGA